MWKRCFIVIAAVQLCAGCLHTGYDPITSTQLARHSMRVVDDDDVVVYFPADGGAGMERATQRLRDCLQRLRDKRKDRGDPGPATVVVHDGEFNNAYVTELIAGQSIHMVLPMHLGLEHFNLLNIGVADVADVSCHEAVHYVLAQEVHGFWRAYTFLFGDVVTPNVALPRWFNEGLATYYESHLGKVTGRMTSPHWHGMFAAGVADREALNAGALHALDRALSGAGSGPYLVGSHFVSYLAQTYGEEKLWELIDMQSRSIFSAFGVTLRFKSVFGKSIGALFADFVASLDTTAPVRARPPEQDVLHDAVGYAARMTTCGPHDSDLDRSIPLRPPGQHRRLALVHRGADAATRLTMYGAQGDIQWSKRLADVLPGRDHVAVSPVFVSGMSFTADCRDLFFTLADVDRDPGYVSRVWRIDAATGRAAASWGPVAALGGGVSADGQRYALIALRQSEARLAVMDLTEGVTTSHLSFLEKLPGVTSMGAPAFSPDGARIVFAGRTTKGFNLFVREQDGQVRQLTDDDAYNYLPRWVDDERLIFLRGVDGRLQAHVSHVNTGSIEAITDAPYTVLDASPWGPRSTVFLSADGWHWNIESAPWRSSGERSEAAAVQNAIDDASPATPANDASAVNRSTNASEANGSPDASAVNHANDASAADSPDGTSAVNRVKAASAMGGGNEGSALNQAGEVSAVDCAKAASAIGRANEASGVGRANEASGVGRANEASAERTIAESTSHIRADASVPYRTVTNFGLPTMRVPVLALSIDRRGVHPARAEVVVTGRDALSYHSYLLDVAYDFMSHAPQINLGYVNEQWAPWALHVRGWLYAYDVPQENAPSQRRVERGVHAIVGRPFWTTQVFAGLAAEDWGTELDKVAQPRLGPLVAMKYRAGEPTPYGGDTWLLDAEISLTALAGQGGTVMEVGAQWNLQTPLPGSKRHALVMHGAARGVWGGTARSLSGPDAGQAAALRRDSSGRVFDSEASTDAAAPGRHRFQNKASHHGAASGLGTPFHGEASDDASTHGLGQPFPAALRGYSDARWLVDRLVVGELLYHYPLILDRGWASLLYVVDEPFLRQVDVDFFASAALHGAPEEPLQAHRAVGAAISVKATFLPGLFIPFGLGYQVAYRFDPTQTWEHRVFVGVQ